MDKYQKFFENYTAQFNMSEWAFGYKHDHTLRVMDLCGDIAHSLKMSKEDIELAKLVGLFHDIGRFEQWREGESFNDRKTFDHGARGVEILKQFHIIDNHPQKELIFAAVNNHNKRVIDPKIEDKHVLRFCKIVRDADKLDIINSVIDGRIQQEKFIVKQKSYSPEALQFFKNHQTIDRKVCPSEADRALTSLSLFFDINSEFSKQYIREHQLITKLVQLYIKLNPDQEKMFRQLEANILEVY